MSNFNLFVIRLGRCEIAGLYSKSMQNPLRNCQPFSTTPGPSYIPTRSPGVRFQLSPASLLSVCSVAAVLAGVEQFLTVALTRSPC